MPHKNHDVVLLAELYAHLFCDAWILTHDEPLDGDAIEDATEIFNSILEQRMGDN